MKVLLVNRFCGGSQIPTGRMLQDVAGQLGAKGHDVQVLASTGRYDGAGHAAGAIGSGVEVLRAPVPPGMPRALAWLWFSWQVRQRVRKLDWDVCVLLTDPPLLPWLAGWIKRQRPSRKVAAWLMDLYPEALAASGRISPRSPLYRTLYRRRQLSLGQTDLLICLGEAQRGRLGPDLTQRVRSAVAPPWDNRPELVRTGDAGLRNLALYAGNLGEAHFFEPILAAAPHLPPSWTIRFAVRGSKAAALGRAVETRAGQGARLEVTGYVGEDETAALLSSARVHLITMSDGWEGIVVPSKLYGCVRTGRPVLFIGPEASDTAGEIRRHGWGACLPCRADGRAVAEAILAQAGLPTSVPALPDGAETVAALISGLAD